ncbi:uncharacterized protein LOC144542419 [Centroberyx gerrardi]
MEHLFRIAFWIFTLSGCLQAKSISINDLNIRLIEAEVKCEPDSEFYSPTDVKHAATTTNCFSQSSERRINISLSLSLSLSQESCITDGLDCFIKELDTAGQECEDKQGRIEQAVDFLYERIDERSQKGFGLTNSTDCACERSSKLPFGDFLKKMKSLVEFHNDQSNQTVVQ